jgi:predicted nucleic acid-binding protein
MERRPDRFTVVLDTSVLAGALIRNTILRLAEAGLFRPRWSKSIIAELHRVLARSAKPEAYIERLLNQLAAAFPEACVENWAAYEEHAAGIPDADDRHIAAVAIKCDAGAIVTANLRDFPADALARFGIDAIGPDDFIADAIDLNQRQAVAALALMRRSFADPAWTADQLVARYDEIGLRQTADLLRPWLSEL